MKGINSVFLLGRLGAEPELRHTRNNTAVLELSVATNRSYKRGDEWEEEVEWHKVTVWGDQATRAATRLNKGDIVAVQGRLKTDQYTDRNDVKRYMTKIVADRLEPISRSTKEMSPGALPGSGRRHLPAANPDLDQIPF